MGQADRLGDLLARQDQEKDALRQRHNRQRVKLTRQERLARRHLLEVHGGYIPLQVGEIVLKHKCEECGSWRAACSKEGRYEVCRVCGARGPYHQRISAAERKLYYMAGVALAADAAGVDVTALTFGEHTFGIRAVVRAELAPRVELRVYMAGGVTVAMKRGGQRDGGYGSGSGFSGAIRNMNRDDYYHASALVGGGDGDDGQANSPFTGAIPGPEWAEMTTHLYDFMEPRWPIVESVVLALRHCVDQGERMGGEHFKKLVAAGS